MNITGDHHVPFLANNSGQKKLVFGLAGAVLLGIILMVAASFGSGDGYREQLSQALVSQQSLQTVAGQISELEVTDRIKNTATTAELTAATSYAQLSGNWQTLYGKKLPLAADVSDETNSLAAAEISSSTSEVSTIILSNHLQASLNAISALEKEVSEPLLLQQLANTRADLAELLGQI